MSGKEKMEYIFTWRIKNYSCCYQENREYIVSPTFTVESLCDSEWFLWFYPKGDCRVNKNDISCYLSCSGPFQNSSVDFKIEIIGKMDIVFIHHEDNHEFTKETPRWGWRHFMAIDKLGEEMNSWNEDILTIRCRIKCNKFKKQTVFGSEVCTTIDVNRRFFEWDVQAPILFEHAESRLFQISDTYKFEITLTSLLEGLIILIQLKDYHEDVSKLAVFKITFCDSEGNEIISKRTKHLFQVGKGWNFPDFITKNLLEICNRNSYKYEFKLKWEIYVSNETILLSGVEKEYFKSSMMFPFAVPKTSSLTAIQNDFRSLFINKKSFDVTIRIGNEDLFAHELVLSARSPVFEAMFDQDMLENKTGVVNVTDVDGKTMKTFLEFLYTLSVENLDLESARKLMFAADKYQVQSLVNECVSFLKSVMSVENACEIIADADSINCECLKSYAIHFIISNAAKILATPAWTRWTRENIQLASNILSKLSTHLLTKYE